MTRDGRGLSVIVVKKVAERNRGYRMKWRVISASVRGSVAPADGTAEPGCGGLWIVAEGRRADDGAGGVGRTWRRAALSQPGGVDAGGACCGEGGAGLSCRARLGQSAICRSSAQQIVDAWVAAVMSDLTHNPFSEAELGALAEAEGERSKDSVVERPELAYGATCWWQR